MPEANESFSSDSPRVSMVLLAYNQEAMVEHAVRSLFAQEYPDLEIVLSDDCSTDGTYAHLQALAAAYRGPARVTVYRTRANRGILSHWLEAVAQTSGEVVMMAAGDDVSYPQRARVSIDALRRERADACYSAYDFIDGEGRIWSRCARIRDLTMPLRDYFEDLELEPLHGASAAYRRHVFNGVVALDTPVFFEDTFFTLSITLAGGRIVFVPEPLVQVRHHAGSVTNHVLGNLGTAALLNQERKQLVYAGSMLAVLRYFAGRICNRARPGGPARQAIVDDLQLWDLRAHWLERPRRLLWRALPAARRRRHLGWLVPRLAGEAAFLRVKRVHHGLKRLRTR